MLPERSRKAANANMLPERSRKAATANMLPERSRKAATANMLPERSRRAATANMLPERSRRATTANMLPERSRRATTSPYVCCINNCSFNCLIWSRNLAACSNCKSRALAIISTSKSLIRFSNTLLSVMTYSLFFSATCCA